MRSGGLSPLTMRSSTIRSPPGFSIAAWREMRRHPPPVGLEVLPADYKVPYSHLHQDPPEVRLARELESRRQKLEVQQRELEMLEDKLRRKLKQKDQ